MPIRFRCQDCRSRVKVPEGTQGKQVKCPRCGRIQTVPKHASPELAHSQADGVTVHTLVGSMHKAPKRKESLVGAGAGTGAMEDRFAGGGVPGGLDIPDPSEQDDLDDMRKQRIARKQRRKMEARVKRAEREREEAIECEEAARKEAIAESRRCVEDIFATRRREEAQHEEEIEEQAPRPVRPAAISLGGNGQTKRESAKLEPVEAPKTEQTIIEATSPRWTLDLSGEAYPFLRIIPWVLRITALMLIGPAFKAMLVADARGFSGVVCLLILFAGLALVVVTWTVGEIATAVRDIALRKAAG